MKYAFWTVAFAMLLSACGETRQTLGTGEDASPYAGTGKAFVDGGWKEGDQASWESHMKARTQQGQNDYGRIN
jgi:major membrane immunogen (membrane-anchored lipoprotein)